MDAKCSFSAIVGDSCTYERRDKAKKTEVIPLLYCTREIAGHKSTWGISDVETEVDLILARAEVFTFPENIGQFTICPYHRSSLGTGWRCGSQRCQVPEKLSGHSEDRRWPKAERGLGKRGAKLIYQRTGVFVAVGSGVCRNCRILLSKLDCEAESTTESGEALAEELSDETEVLGPMENLTISGPRSQAPVAASTPFHLHRDDIEKDASESILSIQLDASYDDTWNLTENVSTSTVVNAPNSLAHLNTFLESRDVSPIREAVSAVLSEAAPEEPSQLWHALSESQETKRLFKVDAERRSATTDDSLLEALATCYNNADQWDTRRQILSIMADKASFAKIQEWIPGLTRYRFTVARQHILLHGRGAPVPPPSSRTRMVVPEDKLAHFLDFITSPQRSSVWRKGGHTIDERVCPASTRKSLQGIDYISSAGAEAFDILGGVADRLGEMNMGMSWAKEQKEHLKKCKRDLKTDYKVHVSASSDVADHCRVYALNDPKDRDYQSQCSHEHNTSCDNCDDLTKTMDEIEAAIEKLASSDLKEELCFVMRKARKDIVNWKAHLLRHQERRRPEPPDDDVRKCIQELQPGWLYSTLRHVRCAKTGQRSSASIQVKKTYYWQDNAGCYHCGTTIVGAKLISQQHDVSIKRLDFCDSQAGKGACDRKAAGIKSHMKIYLNSGNNIESAEEMKDAILSAGGLPSVNVTISGPPEPETFSAIMLEERIEVQSGIVPNIPTEVPKPGPTGSVSLPMGWALRSSQVKRTRFNTSQRDYLTKKFDLGETSGRKADPDSVARAMMTARDSEGNRLFTSAEFLTSKQIASFFSRLAAKRRRQDVADVSDEEVDNAERESALQELTNTVMQEVSLEHPIVYDCYKLCELVRSSKLSSFAIQMLKEICNHFELDTSHIKVKRKKQYVDFLFFFFEELFLPEVTVTNIVQGQEEYTLAFFI
ncbi:hypothetical protein ACROYT_G018879 [Oculina patagonica]